MRYLLLIFFISLSAYAIPRNEVIIDAQGRTFLKIYVERQLGSEVGYTEELYIVNSATLQRFAVYFNNGEVSVPHVSHMLNRVINEHQRYAAAIPATVAPIPQPIYSPRETQQVNQVQLPRSEMSLTLDQIDFGVPPEPFSVDYIRPNFGDGSR